jgi:hypothetical protein
VSLSHCKHSQRHVLLARLPAAWDSTLLEKMQAGGGTCPFFLTQVSHQHVGRQHVLPTNSLFCLPLLTRPCLLTRGHTSAERGTVQTLALGYWTFHYVKRLLETFYVHK